MSDVFTKEFFRTGFPLAIPRGIIPCLCSSDLPEEIPQVTTQILLLLSRKTASISEHLEPQIPIVFWSSII